MKRGRPISKDPKSKKVVLSLTEKDYEKLKVLSFNTGKPMTELLRKGFFEVYENEKERLKDPSKPERFFKNWPDSE